MVVIMTVVVGMPVMRIHVHVSVFYVVTYPAAAFTLFVVGWLTTPGREFVDAPGSRCHYQKRHSFAHFQATYQGILLQCGKK
jgi:hypothetical protein